jgi:nitrogenase molybdenum-iron protein alpha/beta subunit
MKTVEKNEIPNESIVLPMFTGKVEQNDSTAYANFTAARNTCKLCPPLGASLAFRGIEKAIPLLHGSQGCATYIRRYLISHFKEPVDIASSSFGEMATVLAEKATC